MSNAITRDMITVVPTRGRPKNASDLAQAWADAESNSTLVFAVDDDQEDMYRSTMEKIVGPQIQWAHGPRIKMGPTLTKMAVGLTTLYPDLKIVGFMGDDHRPRTKKWDEKIQHAFDDLGGTGIVYGDDLNWGPDLPTSVFMSADIIRTLGYMHPPELIHLYLDNFWIEFGRAIERIAYLPDVIIEHMHPAVGKAFEDVGYLEVNSPEMYDHDRKVLDDYRENEMDLDVQKVKEELLD